MRESFVGTEYWNKKSKPHDDTVAQHGDKRHLWLQECEKNEGFISREMRDKGKFRR
jgi:hypothetical protein